MSFTARMLMIATFVVAFIMGFGGLPSTALAKTNADVRACVDQRFAEEPFTGTLAQKEAQARRLPADKPFGKSQPTLPQGGSLWNYCKTGPSALELATAKVAALEAENANLTRENTALKGNLKSTEAALATVTDERDAALADAKSAGNLAWILGIVAVLAGIVGALLFRIASGTRTALKNLQARNQALVSELEAATKSLLEQSGKREAPTPPQGDADLAAPPAPEPAPTAPAAAKPAPASPTPRTRGGGGSGSSN